MLHDWLAAQAPHPEDVLVLVAHNGFPFDFSFLIRTFHNLPYCSQVPLPAGCMLLDSLRLARQLKRGPGTWDGCGLQVRTLQHAWGHGNEADEEEAPTLLRSFSLGSQNHRPQELRAHFGLPSRPAHRARGDTETLAGVFAHLCAVKHPGVDVVAAMDAWLVEDRPACIKMLRDHTAGAGLFQDGLAFGC